MLNTGRFVYKVVLIDVLTILFSESNRLTTDRNMPIYIRLCAYNQDRSTIIYIIVFHSHVIFYDEFPKTSFGSLTSLTRRVVYTHDQILNAHSIIRIVASISHKIKHLA